MELIKIKWKSCYVILWLQTLDILNRDTKPISDFWFFVIAFLLANEISFGIGNLVYIESHTYFMLYLSFPEKSAF